jgi:predicted nucleic acid-binding protein
VITAVDTSVLLDVLGADPTFGPASREALRDCLHTGTLIASDVVWAETAAWFGSKDEAARTLERLGLVFVPLGADAAHAAAAAWRDYRRSGGARERVIADFLVAAHADVHADRLLTRDRGFYRSRFRKLKLIDPSA